jgi:ribosome recycling factor
MAVLDEQLVKNSVRKIVDDFQNQLKTIHTGRPKPEILENLKVEAYGQTMDLKSLTSVEVLDGKFRLQPWDKSTIKAIEAAIRSSNLGFNPDSRDDGIYISIPPLTQETRLRRVKEVAQMLEEMRVRVRKMRHDFLDEIELVESVSEDEKKAAEKNLQKHVDEANEELKSVADEKELEIMKV